MADKDSKRKALGKGLDALIPAEQEQTSAEKAVAAAKAAPARGVQTASIEQIGPGKHQPRRVFTEEAIEELAESIRQNGILQPLLVRRRKDAAAGEPLFEIIAGERRWRAAQKAGLHEVPIIIKDVDDRGALELSLVENLQRADLNPIEEARGYQRLIEEFSYTPESLAEKIGKARTTVVNSIRLLDLPRTVRELLERGGITPGHVRPLLAFGNDDAIARAASKISSENMSVRQAENLVKRMIQGVELAQSMRVDKPPKDEITMHLHSLERSMELLLGAKVKIVRSRKGRAGNILIKFTSWDDLTRIVRKMDEKVK